MQPGAGFSLESRSVKNTKTMLVVAVLAAVIGFYLYLSINNGAGPPQVAGSQEKPSRRGEQPADGAGRMGASDTAQLPGSGTDSARPAESHRSAPALEPEIREGLERILDTSSEGLEEEPMNGSVGVNLQGRFKTAPVATINEKGEVQITDYSHLPAE